MGIKIIHNYCKQCDRTFDTPNNGACDLCGQRLVSQASKPNPTAAKIGCAVGAVIALIALALGYFGATTMDFNPWTGNDNYRYLFYGILLLPIAAGVLIWSTTRAG